MWNSNTDSEIIVDLLAYLRHQGAGCLAVLAVFAICALTSPQPASAQAVYGSVFGTVADSSGAVVPNATVTVLDVAKGTSVSVQTDASG